MPHIKKLGISVAAASATLVAAMAPAAQATTVCNEAENSFRGGYEVSGGIVDPNPPARLLGEAMAVGNEDAVGLAHAADVSPALRQCAPPDGGPTGTDGDGDGDGGGEGGGIDT